MATPEEKLAAIEAFFAGQEQGLSDAVSSLQSQADALQKRINDGQIQLSQLQSYHNSVKAIILG